jgi:hypothetical protein
VSAEGSTRARAGRNATAIETSRRLVASQGGRYSTELGIDVDRDNGEIERWFLAATLFGTRISAAIAARTFLVLDRAGITRVGRAGDVSGDDLVALLDQGGYARYDFRTATRLQTLAAAVDGRYGGHVAEIGRTIPDYATLRDALDALPGWGPVTVGLFLRELRGVWPGATPPVDRRAADAARHLHLTRARDEAPTLAAIERLAGEAGLDVRDLESGLVRLALGHHHTMGACPGGRCCPALDERRTGS